MAFGETNTNQKIGKEIVMEINENFVTEEVTENVEQTTEETVVEPIKTFTQEEMNAAVGKAKARERAKVEKQYKREYGELVDVLRAGTGKESVGELKDAFQDFYEKKGIKIQKKPTYTEKDLSVLANADAAEFINAGYEDVVEEVDRLANVGFDKLTAREKASYKVLAEYRQNAERSQELAKIGVTEDVYNSAEFQEFASMFKKDIPITKVYENFRKSQPKKEIKPMGSMKNHESGDAGIKDYYTPEEARRFKKKDYDNNPALFAAVEKSMLKWR